jgi:hypothetical protein
MVPLVGSTVLSTNDSLPVTGFASPPVEASTVTAPCFWAASSEVGFRQGKGDVDRVELGDGGQRSGGLHQAARIDVDGADAAGHRGADGRVACVDLAGARGGAAGGERGAGGVDLAFQGVDGALRQEFLGHQVLAALVLALEVGQGCAATRDFRLGLRHAGAVAAVVEREHQLPGFDELAFLDVHFADGAGRLRTQVDGALRGDGAVGSDVDADVLALRGDDVDGGRRHRAALAAALTTALASFGAVRALAFGRGAMVHVPGAADAGGHDHGDDCNSILFHSNPLPRVPAALSVNNEVQCVDQYDTGI